LGSAKAWVNYNGVSQTILGSFNVSSVTYNSTGNYTVNLTTAMPSTNFAVAQSATPNTSDSLSICNFTINSTSAINVYFVIPTVGQRNVLSASTTIFSL
jgi:PKD repeat protein